MSIRAAPATGKPIPGLPRPGTVHGARRRRCIPNEATHFSLSAEARQRAGGRFFTIGASQRPCRQHGEAARRTGRDRGMSYLMGGLTLLLLLGASAAAVLIAVARLVEILPPLVRHEDQEERGSQPPPDLPRGA